MSDETTLLPCPFCGGEAKLIQADNPSYTQHSDGWYVICKCGASLGFHGNDDEYNTYGDFPHELCAIQSWNTRAPVEHDGWFYLPKPKESIVQYGEQRTEKTEHGYKVTQPVEVIEGAIRSWSDELGEYIMKRICEAWSTSTHGTLTAEHVREVIERHVKFYEGGDYDEQAIADELNARAERTCEFKPFRGPISDTDEEGERQGICSVCSAYMHEQFCFCPNCGCKVVDA